MTPIAADVNELALSIFGLVVAITLIVTYFASKRVTSATDFWAAGRGLTGVQNGFAIAGDYMSAASFLGIAGLIFLFGFDGFLYSVGFLVAFLTVLFLLGERMRNSGKYTIADVLSFRMKQKPARAAAALGTLSVAGFYLIAQMVGAGVLIQALVGIDFALSVVITGAFMIIYIVAGGMLATSWVQIIKAVLLMTATIVLSLFVLGKVGWNPIDLFRDGARRVARRRGLPQAGPVPVEPARHALARPGAGARHRRSAAHPDALLHGARRQGGPLVGYVGRGPDRRLLRDDHDPRFRRTRDPGRGRHRGRGRGRQPRSATVGRGGRRRRRHVRGRPVPGDHRGRGLRHDPGRGGRSCDLGLRSRGSRRVVQHRPLGPRLREGGDLGRARSPP